MLVGLLQKAPLIIHKITIEKVVIIPANLLIEKD